jgi:hypothetical protein
MQYGPYISLPAGTYSLQVDSTGDSAIDISVGDAGDPNTPNLGPVWTCSLPAGGFQTCMYPNLITVGGCDNNIEVYIRYDVNQHSVTVGQSRFYKM